MKLFITVFTFCLFILSCKNHPLADLTVNKGIFIQQVHGNVKEVDEYSIFNGDTAHHYLFIFDSTKNNCSVYNYYPRKLAFREYYTLQKNTYKAEVFDADTLRLTNYIVYGHLIPKVIYSVYAGTGDTLTTYWCTYDSINNTLTEINKDSLRTIYYFDKNNNLLRSETEQDGYRFYDDYTYYNRDGMYYIYDMRIKPLAVDDTGNWTSAIIYNGISRGDQPNYFYRKYTYH